MARNEGSERLHTGEREGLLGVFIVLGGSPKSLNLSSLIALGHEGLVYESDSPRNEMGGS